MYMYQRPLTSRIAILKPGRPPVSLSRHDFEVRGGIPLGKVALRGLCKRRRHGKRECGRCQGECNEMFHSDS